MSSARSSRSGSIAMEKTETELLEEKLKEFDADRQLDEALELDRAVNITTTSRRQDRQYERVQAQIRKMKMDRKKDGRIIEELYVDDNRRSAVSIGTSNVKDDLMKHKLTDNVLDDDGVSPMYLLLLQQV